MNSINLQFDLYIHVNDFSKLENGDTVIGYREVSNDSNYELISKYALLPVTQLNDNEFKVCAIIN
jgi:hypothetical protein